MGGAGGGITVGAGSAVAGAAVPLSFEDLSDFFFNFLPDLEDFFGSAAAGVVVAGGMSGVPSLSLATPSAEPSASLSGVSSLFVGIGDVEVVVAVAATSNGCCDVETAARGSDGVTAVSVSPTSGIGGG